MENTNIASDVADEQSEVQEFNELSEGVGQLNQRLEGSTQVLANTFDSYRRLMGLYNDGYELSTEMATLLASKLAAARDEIAELQLGLLQKNQEMEGINAAIKEYQTKIEQYDGDRNLILKEAERVNAEANARIAELDAQLTSRGSFELIQNDLQAAQINNSSMQAKMLETKTRLEARLREANRERATLKSLLRKTFERVGALEQGMSQEIAAFKQAEAMGWQRKEQLLMAYRGELDKLNTRLGEIKDIEQLYDKLILQATPAS